MQKLALRQLLFLFFIVYGFQQGTAQDRSNYELLWEIKHKDGPKKSYLFGTMHVKDARAFQFSDDVLPAIERTEAFALEIHPDSINSGLSSLLENEKNSFLYKDILSEEEYKQLADRFYEVNQSSIDSFPLSHPYMLESMLIKETVKENDKKTFLDAYLYGIAYSLDKDIYGLEQLKDQIPDIENFDKEQIRANILEILATSPQLQAEQLERIIELYFEGDLEKILDYVLAFDGMNQELIDRNHVMTNSMIKIMQEKSLFAAVGTAHLPGTDGIINLLTEKGYEVTPVLATFNSDEKQYDFQPNLRKWTQNEHAELGYEVRTPVAPAKVTIESGADTYMATDMVFGGTFVYLTVDLRGKTLKENYDFIGNMIKSQTSSPTDSLISERRFLKDGAEMAEIYVVSDGSYKRMQVGMANNIIYSFFTENNKEDINSAYTNAFFESIHLFPPVLPATTWTELNNAMGAFKIDLPGEVTDLSQETPNPLDSEGAPYFMNILQARDKNAGTNYLLRYNDQPLGYYLQKEKSILEELKTYFNSKGTVISGPDSVVVKGRNALEMEVLLADKYYTKGQVFIRGNRTYLLLAQQLDSTNKIQEDDRFMNSFEMIPFKETLFDSVIKVDGDVSFQFPQKVTSTASVIEDNESFYEKNAEYYGLDDETGGCFFFQKIKLRPYSKTNSLDAFYEFYESTLIESGDHLDKSKSVMISGYPGRELIYSNSETRIKQRLRYVLVNKHIYMMMAYVAEDQLYSEKVNHFFNSFQVDDAGEFFDISSSKTKRLFKDLTSKDSLTFQAAKGATSYYDFEKKEHDFLVRSLRNSYPDDTLHFSVKYNLLQQLIYLEQPETLDDLASYYLNEKTSNRMKLAVLEFLLNVNNDRAFEVYTNLLLKHPPKRIQDEPFLALSGVSDSLDLVSRHEAVFESLAKKDIYRSDLVDIYSNYIVEDSVLLTATFNVKNTLLSQFKKDASRYVDTLVRKQMPEIDYSLMSNYLELVTKTKTSNKSIIETLQLISDKDDPNSWLRVQAMITGVALDTIFDKQLYDEKLTDLYSRFELMEALNTYKGAASLPKEYMTNAEFGRLSVYNEVGRYTDNYPTSIEYLGQLTHEGGGYQVYTYTLNEDDISYIGIAKDEAPNTDNFQLTESYLTENEFTDQWKETAIEYLNNKQEAN